MTRVHHRTLAKALAVARTSMMPILAGLCTASSGHSSPPSAADAICTCCWTWHQYNSTSWVGQMCQLRHRNCIAETAGTGADVAMKRCTRWSLEVRTAACGWAAMKGSGLRIHTVSTSDTRMLKFICVNVLMRPIFSRPCTHTRLARVIFTCTAVGRAATILGLGTQSGVASSPSCEMTASPSQSRRS